MFTCVHIKIIHSLRQLVTLASDLNVHIVMYSAPVCGRLFHVSRLTAPVGKLANSEVHAKVSLEQLNADEILSSYLSPTYIAEWEKKTFFCEWRGFRGDTFYDLSSPGKNDTEPRGHLRKDRKSFLLHSALKQLLRINPTHKLYLCLNSETPAR